MAFSIINSLRVSLDGRCVYLRLV
ncbi:hypothetical protein Goshw_001023 [Gossypium schwendimanii]|uniref:Uncharacterized protein n=1 Tax=Gossypium schwendimanii TaxID=34291 RepID=A0A7J9MLN0_GOSSC|nr:hypothetical protein [Gossypium schwendimanii]